MTLSALPLALCVSAAAAGERQYQQLGTSTLRQRCGGLEHPAVPDRPGGRAMRLPGGRHGPHGPGVIRRAA